MSRVVQSIKSKRLLLNEINLTDKEAIFKLYADQRVIEFNDIERMIEPVEAEQLIISDRELMLAGKAIRWAIRLKASGQLIGSCGVSEFDYHNGCATIGFEILPKFWRKGFATEALLALTVQLFSLENQLSVHRIQAYCHPENLASITLLKKLGFSFEGRLKHFRYINDDYIDVLLYSLINPN